MHANKRDPLLEANRIGEQTPRVDAPALPSEPDESIAAPAAPQSVMVQAQRDILRGLEDTDCYSRLGRLIPRSRKK